MPPVRRLSVWIASCLLLATMFTGCGAELYEQRLADTRAMFAHQDLLNQNLNAPWGDPQTGINLRVPLQFVLLPPPAKPAQAEKKPAAEGKDAEEGEEEVIDDRQPSYMNIGLPGLRGAFRAAIKYSNPQGGLADGEGFLYVLSNHHLAEQPDLARDFKKQVVELLSEALHVDAEKWNDDRFPLEAIAKRSFVRSVPYQDLILTSSEEIAGYMREFAIYMHDEGDIQVIVLFVLPKDAESSEKLAERIPLCLETLVVSGNKLVPPSAGGAPVGGPGQTSGF